MLTIRALGVDFLLTQEQILGRNGHKASLGIGPIEALHPSAGRGGNSSPRLCAGPTCRLMDLNPDQRFRKQRSGVLGAWNSTTCSACQPRSQSHHGTITAQQIGARHIPGTGVYATGTDWCFSPILLLIY